jgi:hypothetical protein
MLARRARELGLIRARVLRRRRARAGGPRPVEESNFNRQILYRERDLGRVKVEAAAEALRAFDSSAGGGGRARIEGVATRARRSTRPTSS